MFFYVQVQSALMSLEGEELETLKRDLIAIKEIFLEKDFGKEDEDEDEKGDVKHMQLW